MFKNLDSKPVIGETLYYKTPHASDDFTPFTVIAATDVSPLHEGSEGIIGMLFTDGHKDSVIAEFSEGFNEFLWRKAN